MHITWEDAQTFLAIAEERSFSAGARRLKVGQPAVSRRVAHLEERMGCQLFSRGKQGAELTDAGARLLPAAQQMARWATEFERLAQGAEENPAGSVRVAAPPGIAVDVLAPLAAIAKERLPDIRLEVLASVEHVDLSRGTADLAIRTRAPNEPELTTLISATTEIGVLASRAYVERLTNRLDVAGHVGPPGLADLDWVTWAFPFEHVEPRPMLERAIADFEPSFASDNFLVLRAAVAAGLGAMILDRRPLSGSEAGANAGDLVEIDLGFELPKSEFHLVCAKSMRYVPRVRAIAELMIEELGRVQAL
jgi:DNA-binding transcriptional LysR family regulator